MDERGRCEVMEEMVLDTGEGSRGSAGGCCAAGICNKDINRDKEQ